MTETFNPWDMEPVLVEMARRNTAVLAHQRDGYGEPRSLRNYIDCAAKPMLKQYALITSELSEKEMRQYHDLEHAITEGERLLKELTDEGST